MLIVMDDIDYFQIRADLMRSGELTPKTLIKLQRYFNLEEGVRG